jgi:3-oxoacyl-[acyl-carrier protein] reductase
MLDLNGTVAVVTGATKGIGLATARTLADAGATVAVAARTSADVQRVAGELGHGAIGVVCDVQRLADCEHLVAQTVEACGRLDILVNNAGIGVFATVETLSVEDWRRQIATNLDGVFYCCRAALPHLKRNGGWIVNIGSLAGKNPFVGGAAYNATKFGLLGFSEALMLEVRHQGVRVVCVMPGSVASDFSGDAAAGSEWKLHPGDVAQVVGDLLAFPERALPSRVEIRPTRPPGKQ